MNTKNATIVVVIILLIGAFTIEKFQNSEKQNQEKIADALVSKKFSENSEIKRKKEKTIMNVNKKENNSYFDKKMVSYKELEIKEDKKQFTGIIEGDCSAECYGGPFEFIFKKSDIGEFSVTRSRGSAVNTNELLIMSRNYGSAKLRFIWSDMTGGGFKEDFIYKNCSQEFLNEMQADGDLCRNMFFPKGDPDHALFARIVVTKNYKNESTKEIIYFIENIRVKPMFKTLQEKIKGHN